MASAQTATEPKADAKKETQADAKSESKGDARNDSKADAKSDSKADAKNDTKAAGKGRGAVARTGTLHPGYNPKLPTLFLIGDSTVKNSWDAGTDGLWGWGKPLEFYFDKSKVNVENQALGGTSSRSYQKANWPGVLALVKPGDFVMMQFGHNDGAMGGRASIRGNSEETREEGTGDNKETVHTYGWYIRKYITDVKAKGATPIVCSLIPRKSFAPDGKTNRAANGYGGWAEEAAKQEGALFIDLNGIIADHYDQMGEEAAKAMFPTREGTHPNWKGAVLNAQCVIEGLKKLKDCPLNSDYAESPMPVRPSTDKTPE
ncbi:MAG TPA: GDSL-type esterase/lipase family protein [Pirellulales bacterium]